MVGLFQFGNLRYGTFKYLVLSNEDNLLDKRRSLSDECLSGGDKHDKRTKTKD